MPKTAQTFADTPEVLVWARERAGLSVPDAAGRLKLTDAELSGFERGKSAPRVALLELMARKYGLSVTTLLVPAVPTRRARPSDFRTVAGEAPDLSAETWVAISQAQTQQEMLTLLLEEMDEPIAVEVPVAAIEADPENVAHGVRVMLAVTDSEQLGWSGAPEAYRAWRSRLEAEGVLVFQKKMPRADCRGFSISEAGLVPLIVVNSAEADQARLFTLFHEYAHLMLRNPGLCNELELVDRGSVEAFCNRFAAALLMPESTVTMALDSLGFGSPPDWTHDDVRRVARRLNVSMPATALRLERLKYAPPGLYDSLKFSWDEDAWSKQGGGGAVPQHTQILNRLGARYVGVVLDAFDRGYLDSFGTDAYLNAKSKHLDPLRERFAAVCLGRSLLMNGGYVIDTNSIRRVERLQVSPDDQQAIWDAIVSRMKDHVVVTLDLVFEELERHEQKACLDQLGECRKPPVVIRWKTLLEPSSSDTLQKVLNDFSAMSGIGQPRTKADPYLVALAATEGLTVVTEESRSGKQKIPNACEALGIECIDLLDLVIREKLAG